jgi:hypothetical protein
MLAFPLSVASGLILLLACNQGAPSVRGSPDRASVATLEFQSTTGPVLLSGALADSVIRLLTELTQSCSIVNAVTASGWDSAGRLPHLSVRFQPPLAVTFPRRAPEAVTEVRVGVTQPTFIGPQLVRTPDAFLRVDKCSGLLSLRLMCLDSLRQHYPARYRTSCPLLHPSRTGQNPAG